jgi:hypothetical protein
MASTSKERLGAGKPRLGAFDAASEKDVAKREKIKAYNALLLKLAAGVPDAPKNLAATPVRRSKDTARSKDGSSGKKTEVKPRLDTKATPAKNALPPPKLSSASTQDDLAKTVAPPPDKSPLRFNNVKLIEPKRQPAPAAPAPTAAAAPQPQPQKKPAVRESFTRIPTKIPAQKKPSPPKPSPKTTLKPPVPTVAQLRSQTPTPAASTRKVPAPKTPARLQQPQASPAPAQAFKTPAKPAREPQRGQQTVKAAAMTLRLSAFYGKSRFAQLSFALGRLKVEAQHAEIKVAFAQEFRSYSLKKRLFFSLLGKLAETRKR